MKKLFKTIFFTFLFIMLIFSLYFHVNKAKVFADIGNHYVKNQDYENALKFFEKSFINGNTDEKFRKIYVNTIINSPLTLDNQFKLEQILQNDVDDSASANASYFLQSLRQEIYGKYPENYIKQAPYSNDIVHWGKLPITYSYQSKINVPQEFIKAVDDAFDKWETATNAQIRFEKTSGKDANIVINFAEKQIENAEYGRKYVIANTIPSISYDKLNKMDMELSTLDIEGKLYSPNQIYNTALHEIFHALGFI